MEKLKANRMAPRELSTCSRQGRQAAGGQAGSGLHKSTSGCCAGRREGGQAGGQAGTWKPFSELLPNSAPPMVPSPLPAAGRGSMEAGMPRQPVVGLLGRRQQMASPVGTSSGSRRWQQRTLCGTQPDCNEGVATAGGSGRQQMAAPTHPPSAALSPTAMREYPKAMRAPMIELQQMAGGAGRQAGRPGGVRTGGGIAGGVPLQEAGQQRVGQPLCPAVPPTTPTARASRTYLTPPAQPQPTHPPTFTHPPHPPTHPPSSTHTPPPDPQGVDVGQLRHEQLGASEDDGPPAACNSCRSRRRCVGVGV